MFQQQMPKEETKKNQGGREGAKEVFRRETQEQTKEALYLWLQCLEFVR